MENIKTLEEARALIQGINKDNYFDRKMDKTRPATNVWSKSSMFKLWQDPANFLEGPPFKQTPVMVKGQQIDTYVLEPQLFRTKYEVTCKGPWNANPGKADATRIRKMGKTPLKPETMNDIQTILTRLESPGQEETCRQMLSGEPQVAVKGVVECNYLLDGEPFTNFIPLTGLLDSVYTNSDNSEIDIDLKSTGAETAYEMWKISRALGYAWQDVLYTELREANGFRPKAFKFVFVQKEAPFRVQVAEYDDNAKATARIELEEAFALICVLGHGVRVDALYSPIETFGVDSNWEATSGVPEIVSSRTKDWNFTFHAASA